MWWDLLLSSERRRREEGERLLASQAAEAGHASRLLSLAEELPPPHRLLPATLLRAHIDRRSSVMADSERVALRAALLRAAMRASPRPVATQLALSLACLLVRDGERGERGVLALLAEALRREGAEMSEGALLALIHTSKAVRSLAPHLDCAELCALTEGIARLSCAALAELGSPAEVRRAALLCKALRQLLALSRRSAPLRCEALRQAAGEGSLRLLQLASREGGGELVEAWGRLGGALGKLLVELQEGGETSPLPLLLLLLRTEVEARGALCARGGEGAEAALELREGSCSRLLIPICSLLEPRCEEIEPTEIIPSLLALMRKPSEQLREWRQDPESLACSELLSSWEDCGDGEEGEEETEQERERAFASKLRPAPELSSL
ncbi:MAG: hypothetical protein SGPRY_012729 [Prymnesium sp.]